MIKAHRIRLNPTSKQADYFWQCAGVARFTWNWVLNYYDIIIHVPLCRCLM
ncbi:helix-turn-helix domain-containing protein [Chloroflexi bacterium TSY]|nr:helix-turn-helix domain-containing protein [Chloroflexi bacterium TSY]